MNKMIIIATTDYLQQSLTDKMFTYDVENNDN